MQCCGLILLSLIFIFFVSRLSWEIVLTKSIQRKKKQRNKDENQAQHKSKLQHRKYMFYPETIHFVTTGKMTNRQEKF